MIHGESIFLEAGDGSGLPKLTGNMAFVVCRIVTEQGATLDCSVYIAGLIGLGDRN